MRPVLVSIVFVSSAALSCWLLLRLVDAQMGDDFPQVGLDAWAEIAPRIDELAADPREPDETRVAFVGDSTTFIPVGGAIPGVLSRVLQQQTPRRHASVHSLGFSGMNPFDYYYLSGPIQSTHSDQVVMNFNLAVFAEPNRAYYSRPELAAWISPLRWAQAAGLPLHWQGLTFDELLLRGAIVRLGGWNAWYALVRQGVRLEKAYQQLSVRVQGRKQSFRGPFTQRMLWIMAENGQLAGSQGANELRVRYGAALDGIPRDHPILRMLQVAVAEYVDAGVDVTVYVSPIDVARLERVAIYDAAGLASSIERIREAVESAGGRFIDLHDLLPSNAFRDPAGHLAGDGPARVAREIARVIASPNRPSRRR